MTSRSGANSTNAWRQMPQGGVGWCAADVMTTRVKRRAPAAIAVPSATRSAQVPAGYDAFSTLQPAYTWPSTVSSAAPTG